MSFIQNFEQLATTPERKVVLDLVEVALESIEPKNVLQKNFVLSDATLSIATQAFNLKDFERVFLVGFGKGSAGICLEIEAKLGEYLTDGYVIDNVEEKFAKVHFTLGTHPLPSEQNIGFTKNVLEKLTSLTEKDLVLVVICGGGSAMFEATHAIDLETLSKTNKALINSGATISEINVVRKHLSRVKGGGFAKHLYPATIASLLFSDVPGNDLSVIASGPTVMNTTTLQDTKNLLEKFQITSEVQLPDNAFEETPTDQKYFARVHNILMVSNMTAIEAMQEKAKELGYESFIYSDKVQGDAHVVGKQLLDTAKPGQILLAGGETTLKIQGKGRGGRNQTVVLSALPFLTDKTILVSFDSDGQDFYYFAGAIGDSKTLGKAQELGLDQKTFLEDDNSYEFFEKTGDGILTGKLASNVSDLMIVVKL